MDKESYLKLNKEKALQYPLLKKNGYTGFLMVNSRIVKSFFILGNNKAHTFGGYYDINNVSADGLKCFYLQVPKNANPKRNNASILIYDFATNKAEKVATTKAWCWQQGSRIMWLDDLHLIFNDIRNGKYISSIVDIKTKQKSIFLEYPIYDMVLDKHIAVTLNFERLELLRPGYGYPSVNYRISDFAPIDDGVFIVDLKTKEKRLIVSLDELRRSCDSSDNDYHYVNHASFSPRGDKFLFFHVWTKDNLSMWKMELVLVDLKKNNSLAKINGYIFSHYCWMDNENILLTEIGENGAKYYILSLNNLKLTSIDYKHLCCDGHPTFIKDKHLFVSDTYPQENCIQNLFIADINSIKNESIVKAFSDPRMYIDKRCDMHPRVTQKKLLINIDSTFSDGTRKIIFIKLRNKLI